MEGEGIVECRNEKFITSPKDSKCVPISGIIHFKMYKMCKSICTVQYRYNNKFAIFKVQHPVPQSARFE